MYSSSCRGRRLHTKTSLIRGCACLIEFLWLRQLSRQITRRIVSIWKAQRGPLGEGGIFGDMPLLGTAAFGPSMAEDVVKMAAHIPAFRMWLPWNETVSTVYCVHFIPSKHENDIVWISLKGTLNTSIVEERAQCAPRNWDMVNTEIVMYRVAKQQGNVIPAMVVCGDRVS